MEKIKLVETFSGEVNVTFDKNKLTEAYDSSPTIDGEFIIGIVEGQFFQPDGMSRNHRWYPRALWENVLASSDVKNRLLSRTMFGEIGHSDGPVTDMTLRNGEASHIISDLWIDEKGRGMGRAYIINTQKGRDLKTYLGAGAKLKVSTRGEGVYLDGQTKDGHPVIDPDTYELQTIDFVLNPGFWETSATLKSKTECVSEHVEKLEPTVTNTSINENTINAKKEGEKRMTLDTESYIRDLKEEKLALQDEIKALRNELDTTSKALLEAKLNESVEIKKLNEEIAPFKKMGVSAKTINETLKKCQTSLDKVKDENQALTEELNKWKSICGSPEQIQEATELSEKALNKLGEYQKLGTVEQLTELVQKSEEMQKQLESLATLADYQSIGTVEELKRLSENCTKILPKLKTIQVLKEYRKIGTVEEIKKLSENCKSILPKLDQLKVLGEYTKIGTVEELKRLSENCTKLLPRLNQISLLEEYKKLGTVEDIKALSEHCESILPVVEQLKDAKRLAENVEKVVPQLNETAELKKYAKKAQKVIESYVNTVGSLKEARALVETRKDTIKKVNVKEALDTSKKFGCTVESAAKLIKKYGVDKTNQLLEAEVAKRTAAKEETKVVEIAESTQLIEEVAQMDKVTAKEETMTAKDFVTPGLINNAFNLEALGKKIQLNDIDSLNGTKVEGENQATALLKKYNLGIDDVEKAPKTEPEKTPEEAEKIAKKLLK